MQNYCIQREKIKTILRISDRTSAQTKHMIKSLLASLAIAVMVSVSPAISWGLSPNTNEIVPAAPDGVETLLKEYNGLYVSDTEEKKVFLTFDLGYEAGYTSQILDTLKQHDIKAVFFLCSHYLTEKDLVDRMLAEGHTIGNHTDKHKDLPNLSREAAITDIMTFQNKFIEKYPDEKPPVFFRPPQGRIDQKTLEIAKENNLRTMMWSIAIVDWGKSPIDAQRSADKIASRVHPGAIVLLHITNSGTPKMLELLIPKLIEKGYQIGNHDEII